MVVLRLLGIFWSSVKSFKGISSKDLHQEILDQIIGIQKIYKLIQSWKILINIIPGKIIRVSKLSDTSLNIPLNSDTAGF